MKKIAVLLAGPQRYCSSVIERINNVIGGIDVDIFCFIWSEDNGNKVRVNSECFDVNNILNQKNVKSVIASSPFVEKDYKGFFKSEVEKGQSSLSSIMGMFYSMDVLIRQIYISPVKYDYVLRLRTDCLILDEGFFHKIKISKNVLLVSKNYLIPHAWISDHIMAGSVENMYKIWSIGQKEEFYKNYQKSGMNPEKFLSKKINELNFDFEEKWKRYLDYQIVYSPAKENDPVWIKRVNDITKAFQDPLNLITEKDWIDIKEMVIDQKKNQDAYSKPLIVRGAKKIWKKLFL